MYVTSCDITTDIAPKVSGTKMFTDVKRWKTKSEKQEFLVTMFL